jgi:hypothetical protein
MTRTRHPTPPTPRHSAMTRTRHPTHATTTPTRHHPPYQHPATQHDLTQTRTKGDVAPRAPPPIPPPERRKDTSNASSNPPPPQQNSTTHDDVDNDTDALPHPTNTPPLSNDADVSPHPCNNDASASYQHPTPRNPERRLRATTTTITTRLTTTQTRHCHTPHLLPAPGHSTTARHHLRGIIHHHKVLAKWRAV